MSSHEERKQKVLNMKVSDLSITKYIKPEDQHRLQELEEKLQKAIQMHQDAGEQQMTLYTKDLKLLNQGVLINDRNKDKKEELNHIMILNNDVEEILKKRLVDLISYGIALNNQAPDFPFEQYLKPEACSTVRRKIQYIHQLEKIANEYETTYQLLWNENSYDDYTEEQKKKIKLLKHIAKRNKEIFSITSSKVSYNLAEKEVIDNLK